MRIQFVDHLSPEKINSIGILIGTNSSNVTIRSMVTRKVLKHIETKLIDSKSTQNNPAISNFATKFMGIFMHLCGIEDSRDISVQVPAFEKLLHSYRLDRSREHHLRDCLNPKKKMCPHCGKEFTCRLASAENCRRIKHIRQCQLETAVCNCKLTFKSPADKRRHMLLNHSNEKYLECPHCPYLTRNQAVMDKHIGYTHGFPGMICSCLKESLHAAVLQ